LTDWPVNEHDITRYTLLPLHIRLFLLNCFIPTSAVAKQPNGTLTDVGLLTKELILSDAALSPSVLLGKTPFKSQSYQNEEAMA
jgi:hypothetical protein